MTKRPNRARGGGERGRGLAWRRILVPLDFSKVSLRALDVAVPVAREHGARLFLLSVVEPAVFAGGTESMAMAVPDAVIAREDKKNLVRVAKRCVPAGVPVRVMVNRGRAADVIARVAREQAIDLVVLTTHGRSGVDRFLMGSTAERVVRHARCPVWVVRGVTSGKR